MPWYRICNLLCIVVHRMGNVGDVYSFFDQKSLYIPKSFIIFLRLAFPGFICATLFLIFNSSLSHVVSLFNYMNDYTFLKCKAKNHPL